MKSFKNIAIAFFLVWSAILLLWHGACALRDSDIGANKNPRLQYIKDIELTRRTTCKLYQDKITGYYYMHTAKGFCRLWRKYEASRHEKND